MQVKPGGSETTQTTPKNAVSTPAATPAEKTAAAPETNRTLLLQRVGQQVLATVTEVQGTRQGDQRVTLNLPGLPRPLITLLGKGSLLQPGQQLPVEIVPGPAIRILSARPASSTTMTLQQNLIQWLPQQNALRPLLRLLLEQAPRPDQAQAQPGPLLRGLIPSLPQVLKPDLLPDQLRQWLSTPEASLLKQSLQVFQLRETTSTTRLETLLREVLGRSDPSRHTTASSTPSTALLPGGPKLQLLAALLTVRAASSGTPTTAPTLPTTPPSTLLHPTRFPLPQGTGDRVRIPADVSLQQLLLQAVARFQVLQVMAGQQTSALQAETGNGQVWIGEVPVFSNRLHTIQVHMQRHHEKKSAGQARSTRWGWRLTLGFDFEELDFFQARLSYLEGSVSATIWSEGRNTLKVLQRHLPTLRAKLLAAGLEVGDLDVRHGNPPEPGPIIQRRLLDEKA